MKNMLLEPLVEIIGCAEENEGIQTKNLIPWGHDGQPESENEGQNERDILSSGKKNEMDTH